jgi:hypothetical protein
VPGPPSSTRRRGRTVVSGINFDSFGRATSVTTAAGENARIDTYRRNYFHCKPRRCGRSGTVVLLQEPLRWQWRLSKVAVEAGITPEPVQEGYLFVICEKCGRRWVPSTGPGLRVLGR